MNETLSSVEFNTYIPAEQALEVINSEGAVAIHNFATIAQTRRAAIVLGNAPMWLDENLTNKVPRRQEMAKYSYSHGQPWAPQIAGMELPHEPVFAAAQLIDEYVSAMPESTWRPNEIIGHRYEQDYFIGKHRDFTRDAMGFIAVLTVAGSQVFGFERDNGEEATVTVKPGTLTLIRGYQPGQPNARPNHWVEPATERRLAVSLRQISLDWD